MIDTSSHKKCLQLIDEWTNDLKEMVQNHLIPGKVRSEEYQNGFMAGCAAVANMAERALERLK